MFEAGARFTGTALQEDEFHWVTTNRDGLMVPDNCRVERIISRPLRNQNIDLAMVARCAIVPDSAR
jgi:Leu/Phe-tRNA-protein transferase